jgi:hypothetical protein
MKPTTAADIEGDRIITKATPLVIPFLQLNTDIMCEYHRRFTDRDLFRLDGEAFTQRLLEKGVSLATAEIEDKGFKPDQLLQLAAELTALNCLSEYIRLRQKHIGPDFKEFVRMFGEELAKAFPAETGVKIVQIEGGE